MKIALIAPIEETVPPQKYGGTEWIVYALAHGLGKKGHEVDLYASGDSPQEEYYNLISISERSVRTDDKLGTDQRLRDLSKLYSVANILTKLQENKYDVIHNHIGWRLLIFEKLIKSGQLITTHHKSLSKPSEQYVFLKNPKLPHISISNNQRNDLPSLNFIATVYNGLDLSAYPFSDAIGDYMFFLARMSPEKGAIQAAKTAMNTKKKLIVAAKVDLADKEYFEEFKTFLDDQYVNYIGELGREKVTYLQNARCLLAPINWEEPFGLMFAESMACGTPVVAFARGSVPEVIKDGETGFIVNSSDDDIRGDWIVKKTGIKGLCEAVEKIYSMPESEYRQVRRACRAHVEKNFTVERMVDQYEEVYKKILTKTN